MTKLAVPVLLAFSAFVLAVPPQAGSAAIDLIATPTTACTVPIPGVNAPPDENGEKPSPCTQQRHKQNEPPWGNGVPPMVTIQPGLPIFSDKEACKTNYKLLTKMEDDFMRNVAKGRKDRPFDYHQPVFAVKGGACVTSDYTGPADLQDRYRTWHDDRLPKPTPGYGWGQGGQQQGGQWNGNQPQGGQWNGNQPQGGQWNGNQPQGGQWNGNQPQGGSWNGNQAQGGQWNGNRPQGGQWNGNQAQGGQRNGNQPQGGSRNGNPPQGGQWNGNRPQGGQWNGNQPQGGQWNGNQPQGGSWQPSPPLQPNNGQPWQNAGQRGPPPAGATPTPTTPPSWQEVRPAPPREQQPKPTQQPQPPPFPQQGSWQPVQDANQPIPQLQPDNQTPPTAFEAPPPGLQDFPPSQTPSQTPADPQTDPDWTGPFRKVE